MEPRPSTSGGGFPLLPPGLGAAGLVVIAVIGARVELIRQRR